MHLESNIQSIVNTYHTIQWCVSLVIWSTTYFVYRKYHDIACHVSWKTQHGTAQCNITSVKNMQCNVVLCHVIYVSWSSCMYHCNMNSSEGTQAPEPWERFGKKNGRTFHLSASDQGARPGRRAILSRCPPTIKQGRAMN